MFFVLLANIIYVPLKYSFNLSASLESSGDSWVFKQFSQTLFAFDILLMFFTGEWNLHTICN